MDRKVNIITNGHERPIIEAHELTPKEREEFDYIKWDAIDRGEDRETFFRYKGKLYDTGEFMYIDPERYPAHWGIKGWEGIKNESFFSGMLIRYSEDFDYVIVARYYT